MGFEGHRLHPEPQTFEGRRARLSVAGAPVPTRSLKPPLQCRPELEPGFPAEYVADPSKIAAVRIYAEELAWQMRIAQLLERQLNRLEAIAEARLTTRSTDAAIATAIVRTAEYIEKVMGRLRDLTPTDPERMTEGALNKLAYLTKELEKLQKQRRATGARGVATDAEIIPPEPQPVVFEPVDNGAPEAKP